jgi:thiol-disulfide isomerase/thioredoxin
LGTHADAEEAISPPFLRNLAGQFLFLEPGYPAPTPPLRTLDGHLVTLADFRGRVVLINFWATWCAPCVAEMASLDALASAIPAGDFVVVAVSLDQGTPDGVRSFIADHRLQHLTVLLDPLHQLGSLPNEKPPVQTFLVANLPASYVLDRNGIASGFLSGPTEWNSPKAHGFVNSFLAKKSR